MTLHLQKCNEIVSGSSELIKSSSFMNLCVCIWIFVNAEPTWRVVPPNLLCYRFKVSPGNCC